MGEGLRLCEGTQDARNRDGDDWRKLALSHSLHVKQRERSNHMFFARYIHACFRVCNSSRFFSGSSREFAGLDCFDVPAPKSAALQL